MSHDPHNHAAHGHHEIEMPHATMRDYVIGFVLSVILTAIPFWLVTLMFQLSKHGLIAANKRRVMCLSMFWHFLDVVWIGVFTFVYLMGVLR